MRSNKTKLGLSQWELHNKPDMDDFNEDNLIIDKELQNRYTKSEVDAHLSKKVNSSESIPASGDLNNYTIEGFYYHGFGSSSILLNRPPISEAFALIVLRSGASTNGKIQVLITSHGNKIFTRGYNKNNTTAEWAWMGWNQIVTSTL